MLLPRRPPCRVSRGPALSGSAMTLLTHIRPWPKSSRSSHTAELLVGRRRTACAQSNYRWRGHSEASGWFSAGHDRAKTHSLHRLALVDTGHLTLEPSPVRDEYEAASAIREHEGAARLKRTAHALVFSASANDTVSHPRACSPSPHKQH